MINDKKRNLTSEMAVKILRREGIEITIESAKLVLDLMYKFSILAVNQIIKEKGSEK